MNNSKDLQTPFQIALYHGAILGAVSCLQVTLQMFASPEAMQNPLVGITIWLFNIGFTVYVLRLACLAYLERGYMPFGEGLKISALTGLVCCAMSAVWVYVQYTLLDPKFISNLITQTRLQFEKQGLSDSQIEEQMRIMSYFMTPAFFAGISFLSGVIGTIVIGLIVSAVMKKDHDPFQSI